MFKQSYLCLCKNIYVTKTLFSWIGWKEDFFVEVKIDWIFTFTETIDIHLQNKRLKINCLYVDLKKYKKKKTL